MTSVKCLICGGNASRHVVISNYTYWKCDQCYTAQLQPQPPSSELNNYYEQFHDTGGTYEEFERRARQDFASKVKLVKSSGKSQLLDVACGKGYFVKACLDAGISAEGIDVSQTAINYAVNKLHIKAVCGHLETAVSNCGTLFDIVTFWAGIEHVPNPREVLGAIHDCLKPGGIFMFDTGLENVALERYLPGYNQWYSAPEHLFVFSRKGLTHLLEQAGFEIIKVDENYDRNAIRRYIRNIRHASICLASYIVLRPMLGTKSYMAMKENSKWPIGKLVNILCKKK